MLAPHVLFVIKKDLRLDFSRFLSSHLKGQTQNTFKHTRSAFKQFIVERDVYYVLFVNGDCYVFKPAQNENPDEDRPAYIPQVELVVYELFRRLQGKHISKCYGTISLRGKRGLLMENCGQRTFECPSQDDEKAKFIHLIRAMCTTGRCMAAGLVHPDSDFQNITYNSTTLQVRIIDIKEYTYKKPQDV